MRSAGKGQDTVLVRSPGYRTIETVRVMVVVFTDESNASKQVLNEIANAVQAGVVIVPFRLTDSQPSRSLKYYFTSVHWLDAVDLPLERSIQELSGKIRKILDCRPPQASGQSAGSLPNPAGKKKRLLPAAVLSGLLVAAACVFLFIRFAEKPSSSPVPAAESAVLTPDVSAGSPNAAPADTAGPSGPASTPVSNPDYDYDYQIAEGAAWITRYRGSGGIVAVPETIDGLKVRGIAENAFDFSYTLTEVTLPETVTHIGGSAFANCTVLERISIPPSVVSIGARAFSRCVWLHTLSIPDSVTDLDTDHLFDSCSALTGVRLPSSVTRLKDGAFRNCTRLSEITIPDNVTEIGENALAGCTTALFVRSGSPADKTLETLGLKHQHTSAADMTVMVYMAGADLESRFGIASGKIREMIESGFDDERINLVIMAGGAESWQGYPFEPDQVTVIRCSSRSESFQIVRKIPGMSMGDPETLSLLLQYGAENLPADAYSLIFFGHGEGPLEGICHDENHSGDPLTLEELGSALSSSPFSSRKLSWIGFDTSIMASVETAAVTAPYADYMIASQSVEYAEGWDYGFLKGLELDADGAETGARIIDAVFAAGSGKSGKKSYQAMSCVKLDEIRHVEACMDELFIKAAGLIDQGTFSGFEKGRGFAYDSEKMKIAEDIDLVDLASLCGALAGDDPDGAARTREAVEKAVVCKRSDDGLCCGLMVYHPYKNLREFESRWRDVYTRLKFCPGYTAYIVVFSRFMLGDAPEI